ncbi:MAG: glutamate-5-semialdehyde dehydrogenase [Candidatus Omnitrophica bacterium]|nr:glutamate-5-semialdehyde dehydrogenase [Candidatus Omnitrophota bacterium]
MNTSEKMKDILCTARSAARELAVAGRDKKDKALLEMASSLELSKDEIKKANLVDIEKAEKNGKTKAFIDRLKLDDERIDAMVAMLRDVAKLDDPVGKTLEKKRRPNGLLIEKVSVPIGVIGIIYESRPNVTADCVALCVKSGNVAILRGGSDAINSNIAVYNALKKGAEKEGLLKGSFILIEDTSREMIDAMLSAVGGIDLVMPRGGESLISEVASKSRIPVIKHYKGICHVYVDSKAKLDMAENICINAKVQRPGVCNAMETMLVHEKVAGVFLPRIAEKLFKNGVRIKGCAKTRDILKGSAVEEATEKDYYTEWLGLVLSVKVVTSLSEAVEHISKYGSSHSDAIVTEDKKAAAEFTACVDSAAVYVNASTRFTDGGEFGKGAEIGISTDKIHARGPMGLEELCSYKYIVHGCGQVRS